MDEDKRAAAGIHAGISAQVFGASLVLMGVLIGYLDIKNIEYLSWAGILTFVSLILLFASIINAGLGLEKLRNNGAGGNWSLDTLHVYFRRQTYYNFGAILLFIIIVVITNEESKEDKFQKQLIELELKKLQYDSLNKIKNEEELKILKDLSNNVDSLNTRLNNLNCCKKRKKSPCP